MAGLGFFPVQEERVGQAVELFQGSCGFDFERFLGQLPAEGNEAFPVEVLVNGKEFAWGYVQGASDLEELFNARGADATFVAADGYRVRFNNRC